MERVIVMKNERLVALRASLTQKEVAEAIGIPVSTYSMIEEGRRFPRKDLLVLLARHFGVTADYLFLQDASQLASTEQFSLEEEQL